MRAKKPGLHLGKTAELQKTVFVQMRAKKGKGNYKAYFIRRCIFCPCNLKNVLHFLCEADPSTRVGRYVDEGDSPLTRIA